jgi:hypothetical protein
VSSSRQGTATRPSGSSVDVRAGGTTPQRNDERRHDGRTNAQRNDVRRHDERTTAQRHDRGYDGRNVPQTHGRSHGYRQPYYAHGRVTRVIPYSGGYRVWIAGAPYPFFMPAAHYRTYRPRVGISIRLGGYYNPLGYYDYYDSRAYSAGILRGVVESVDYRRDTFVVRNEASRSFVTVVMRDRYREVRPGDYVEVSGDWTRSGYFDARYVELLDYGYRR